MICYCAKTHTKWLSELQQTHIPTHTPMSWFSGSPSYPQTKKCITLIFSPLGDTVSLHLPLISSSPMMLSPFYIHLLTVLAIQEGGRGERGESERKRESELTVLSHGPQQAVACLISQLSCVSVSLSRMLSLRPSEHTTPFSDAFIYSDSKGETTVSYTGTHTHTRVLVSMCAFNLFSFPKAWPQSWTTCKLCKQTLTVQSSILSDDF